MTTESHRPFRIVVVCAANRARSPAAAQLLVRAARSCGRGDEVTVVDAGLSARNGERLLPAMATAMIEHGLSTSGHLSQVLTMTHIKGVDLVLTMTEDQRRFISRHEPALTSRCFTLKELHRLVSSPAWDPSLNGTTDVVDRLHELRPFVMSAEQVEDIPDPADGNQRLAKQVMQQLASAVNDVAEPLFGPAKRPG